MIDINMSSQWYSKLHVRALLAYHSEAHWTDFLYEMDEEPVPDIELRTDGFCNFPDCIEMSPLALDDEVVTCEKCLERLRAWVLNELDLMS